MSRRDGVLRQIMTEEQRAALRADAELAAMQLAARVEAKRLAKNERARERRAAKKQGKKLCTAVWIKRMDLWKYPDVPSVYDLVQTPLQAVCKKLYHDGREHGEMKPKLVHFGGNVGHCKCLDCGKGLVWKACCVACNAHFFPLG